MDAQTTYGILGLLPPLLAIVLAILSRQVIISLVVGIFTGALIINGFNPLTGLLDTFSTYIVEQSLADSWNIGIIVFCLTIGGMVGVIGKMGGTSAIAEAIVKRARSVKSTNLATALMGIAIFFDDYANSMIVGNTMRPITDAQKISREKLAYIVDSTAAPVSSMAPVSTWIAMEIGLIAAGLASVGIEGNAFLVFFQSIPFRFYSLFALVLVFVLTLSNRDFGGMLKAEIRARKTGEVYAAGSNPLVSEDRDILPDEGVRGKVYYALIPILVFILVTIFGLWYNGFEEGKSIRDSFGDADASVVLTWAACIGSIVAIIIGVAGKVFTLKTAMDAWVGGFKSMTVAGIILGLAFALKSVIGEMGLAEYLVEVTQGLLGSRLLPLIVFILAMLIAFATGTSWGTNAILMPIVIPIAASISGAGGEVTPLIVASIGAVLTGAVFGDHCSPISDTTILSSMASGSDHIAHVRTQIPYAVLAAAFAAVFGFLPAGFGVPPVISLVVGAAGIILFVRLVGKKAE
ncbi:MAG: Na+/H+ antiporter NhaC family protein [Spirochaetales bacterium]|nr:Na+/H+ antiporter NhaC family protein [Spirochaetales bacterium]